MKKTVLCLMLIICAILSGCSPADTDEVEAIATVAGTWKPCGVYTDNKYKFYDFNSSNESIQAVKKMYDADRLSIQEDGSFSYCTVDSTYSGEIKCVENSDGSEAFMLKTSKIYNNVKMEYSAVNENGEDDFFFAADKDGKYILYRYDPLTGKGKEENLLIQYEKT